MNILLGQVEVPPAEVTGIDGFLGTRASFMMDVVVCAMALVLVLLAASVYSVKYRHAYSLHKRLQLTLAIVLLIVVAAFEIDIQYVSIWEPRAEPSPYFSQEHLWTSPAGVSLLVHLCFSVPTFLLWTYVVVQALRLFPSPPRPSSHSRSHALLGKLGSIGMLMTAVTGWVFYWLAFVAT